MQLKKLIKLKYKSLALKKRYSNNKWIMRTLLIKNHLMPLHQSTNLLRVTMDKIRAVEAIKNMPTSQTMIQIMMFLDKAKLWGSLRAKRIVITIISYSRITNRSFLFLKSHKMLLKVVERRHLLIEIKSSCNFRIRIEVSFLNKK